MGKVDTEHMDNNYIIKFDRILESSGLSMFLFNEHKLDCKQVLSTEKHELCSSV